MQRGVVSAVDERAVLFFDIDGTLVYHRKSENGDDRWDYPPSPAVVEAIHELRERGHQTFICTGRPMSFVVPSLRALDLTGIVAAAGACIEIDGKVVEEHIISADLLAELVDRALHDRVELLFEGGDGCVGLMPAGMTFTLIPGVPTAHSLDEMAEHVPALRFNKFCYRKPTMEGTAFWDFIQRDYCNFNLPDDMSEVCLKGINKGAGVARVLELLGHGTENTYGFGDSQNDLPMRKAVSVPVAMGNAEEAIKEVASYVTDTVENDGVVSALKHFGLIA